MTLTQHSPGRFRAASGKPAEASTVVFVDDDHLWHSFHQVAALVRRNGYQTMRVTTAPAGRLTRLNDRLVYDRTVYLDDGGGMNELAPLLGTLSIAQLHMTETTLAAVPEAVYDAVPEHIAAQLRLRRRFNDKAQAAVMATECGVRVPAQLAGTVRPEDAATRLGLPLVLKKRIGAAGSGVTIAGTPAEVQQAAEAMGSPQGFYYEQFIRGELLCYAAMVGAEGIVQELTYRGLKSSLNPTGAPLAYEVIHDPALTTIGRRMCDGSGARGPVGVQTIRDSDGVHWMIDLNLRPLGGMLSYEQTAVDTAAGYLYSAGLVDKRPAVPSAPVGLLVSEFPNNFENLARSRRYWPALQTYLRHSPSVWSLFGVNYLAFSALTGIAYKLGNRALAKRSA